MSDLPLKYLWHPKAGVTLVPPRDDQPQIYGISLAQHLSASLQKTMDQDAAAILGYRLYAASALDLFAGKPPPLDYEGFSSLVKNTLAEQCPRATVVTDHNEEFFLYWFDLLGIKTSGKTAKSRFRNEWTVTDWLTSVADEDSDEGVIPNLIRRLGEREAGL